MGSRTAGACSKVYRVSDYKWPRTEVILVFARKEVLELVKKKGSVAPKLKNIALLNISLDEVGGRALAPPRETSAASEILLSIR
ncbi:hypothetical protein V500_05213 [Pseudogymnoascus sp. VKM F-4518 (FW-2643)]|nr:hypothetical protein V500_05213 [Pseudogymnoascus sp. VKM F-4518 (FW-2643)]